MNNPVTFCRLNALLLAAPLIVAACSFGPTEALPGANSLSESPTSVADPTVIPSTPTATVTPEVQPTSTPVEVRAPKKPVINDPLSGPNLLPEPPERDLYALALRFGKVQAGVEPDSNTVKKDGGSYEVGHSQSFFVNDLVDNTTYTIMATLRVVSENAYWYGDDDEKVSISDQALLRGAEVFESEIRPGMVRSLGDIRNPGVDGDPRLTVLHTPLRAADGYFGSSDEYPQSIHPHSNQREMIYMDVSRLTPGSYPYLSVLAHELQHAIHWNLDGGEDAWINEGMSELAKEQVGYDTYFVDAFLRKPEVQLNFWPDEIGTSAPHYGASLLFLAYVAEYYGGYEAMGDLVREQADGINALELHLSKFGQSFEKVFKSWAVANYLDADSGPYRYPDRSVKVQSIRRVFAELQEVESLPQFAARYYDLRLPDGDYLLDFSGGARVAQVDTQCWSGQSCWWSGNGDSIDSMLTRDLDLTGLTHATLEFWTWFDIEEGWDYAYVSVSADGGQTWDILEGEHTTADDPVGNNFGTGFTAKSGQWVQESMDISEFAGEKIQLRFEYITDDAVNLDGFVLDDIAVPELGLLDDAETEGSWTGAGFQLIGNALPQKFAVQVIEFGLDGDSVVREIDLEGGIAAQAQFAGLGKDIENVVLVITPLTRGTFMPSGYSLSITADGG